jgi:hypothetical protein
VIDDTKLTLRDLAHMFQRDEHLIVREQGAVDSAEYLALVTYFVQRDSGQPA